MTTPDAFAAGVAAAFMAQWAWSLWFSRSRHCRRRGSNPPPPGGKPVPPAPPPAPTWLRVERMEPLNPSAWLRPERLQALRRQYPNATDGQLTELMPEFWEALFRTFRSWP
jgi:hypothetical protein